MEFLVQTVNGKTALDLCQSLEKSAEFHDWRGDYFDVSYCDISEITDVSKEVCPVGTLEFVFKYVDRLFGKNAHLKILPLNVPEWAQILDDKHIICNIDTVTTGLETIENLVLDKDHSMFMKSSSVFKSPINGFITSKDQIKPNVQLVSEKDIVSEWRMFVHKGQCIDIKNYSGDPFCFPDNEQLDKIKKANDSIKEGTIDICIESDGYVSVIECHDFFSCGLYGFEDLDALPLMLWRTWIKIRNQIERGSLY